MKMYEEFTNKIVVVTGAGGGIGRAVCEAFGKEGAIVQAADIDIFSLEPLIKIFKQLPGSLDCYKIDVSQPNECESLVKGIVRKYKTIDVLFNNAGITKRANVLQTSIQEWDRVMDVNLKSFFLMSKYTIPYMYSSECKVIINTASGWGINGGENAVSYCASKGGVVLLTKAMAIDHGPDGFRVNCICPGDTDTNMLSEEALQLGLPSDQLVKEGVNRPLRRIGQPSEISDAVLYLSSTKSSFITGTSLIVDGGGLAGSN
jgi:NAD(P)-dependent dehydrogenase (short-subunit alcohol dehydrogenase family)